ncbi:(2Fe-2S)-binding protein, partial [Stutzerimonas balearica]
AARDWLKALWARGSIEPGLRRWLLAPLSTPPGVLPERDPTICNCLNIGRRSICDGIARGLDLPELQRSLGCGTRCGSCVPEIKRLLAQLPLAESA